jgi:ABC-type sugar transport system ATPase subunit
MFALQAKGIAKAYGGVIVLKGADFAVRLGSVHALLGENDAGKLTLVKTMTAAAHPRSFAVPQRHWPKSRTLWRKS